MKHSKQFSWRKARLKNVEEELDAARTAVLDIPDIDHRARLAEIITYIQTQRLLEIQDNVRLRYILQQYISKSA